MILRSQTIRFKNAVPFLLILTRITDAMVAFETCKALLDAYPLGAKISFGKARILENCVYRHLRDKTAQEENQTLWEDPPLAASGEKVEITIQNLILAEVNVYEASKDFYAIIFFDMAWNDHRLRWNSDTWRIKEIHTDAPFKQIWTPDISKDESTGRAFGAVSSAMTAFCASVNVTNDGLVTCRSGPTAIFDFVTCTHNLHDFPRDEFNCCATMAARIQSEYIKFKIPDPSGKIQRKHLSQQYLTKSITASTLDRDNGAQQALQFCVAGARKSELLRIEITLPMIISAIVCLVSPIIPKLKQQMFVKLFALLLEFLCFEFLFENRPTLLYADEVPKIHRFYEFTIAMTLASIVLTFLTMFLLNCQQRFIPPPRTLLAIARIVNRCCGCLKLHKLESVGPVAVSVVTATNGATTESGPKSTSMSTDSNLSPWAELWAAFHNAVSAVLAACYIVGIIAITA